jgi:hypothetical protein
MEKRWAEHAKVSQWQGAPPQLHGELGCLRGTQELITKANAARVNLECRMMDQRDLLSIAKSQQGSNDRGPFLAQAFVHLTKHKPRIKRCEVGVRSCFRVC